MDLFTALITLNVLLDIVGMFLFSIVIRAVIKHKTLHGTCHLLIGVFALCGFCSKSITLLPYINRMTSMASNGFFFPICIIFYMLPLTLMHGYFPMLLAISFDRLLCVCCPIWYKVKRNKKLYLFLVLAMSSFFPTFFVTQMVKNTVDGGPSSCIDNGSLITSPLTLKIKSFYTVLILACYLISLAKHFYACKIAKIQSCSFLQQQLYKSLSLLICIEIARFLIINFIGYIGQVDLSDEQKRIIITLLSCFISVLTSSEVPILVFTSSEYRKALRKDFAWILCHSSSNNSVVVTIGISKSNVVANFANSKP